MEEATIDYTLFLADSSLILAQQNAAWCGHGPVLEQDIALSNIALDLLGQSRYLYQYAASLLTLIPASSRILSQQASLTEDDLAYLRTEREFKNCLLVEQPNGDWGQTVLRQFFYAEFLEGICERLINGTDTQLAAIAEKAAKEVRYHVRWSSEWVLRLGDGTEESHRRMQQALDNLWRFTGELFQPAPYEYALFEAATFGAAAKCWLEQVSAVLDKAHLSIPHKTYMQQGGKTGTHTEKLGYLLAEMQYLQRTYPGAKW